MRWVARRFAQFAAGSGSVGYERMKRVVVLSIMLRAWCGEPLEWHIYSSLSFSNKAVIDSPMLGWRREQTASRRK